MRKAIVVVAVLTASAGAGLYWKYGAPPLGNGAGGAAPAATAPGAPPAVPIEAAKVSVGTITREIVAVGSLRSDESVIIRPEIAGRVVKILFNEGQRIEKGEPLLKLDDTTLRAQLEQARANEALAEANANRANTLARQGAGTERARDEAASNLRVTQAAVEVARAALEKTVIAAPFGGIVGLRAISVGAYVQPGQDIVNLENIDPIKVDFRIPEIYLQALQVGQTVAVSADAFPGRSFNGTVYAIDPQVDVNGRSIQLRARIPNPDLILRPGQFVRLALKIDEARNAVSVPEEAILPRGNDLFVYKVIEGKAVLAPVKAGKRAKGMVEIVEGLAPDEMVVTAGHMKIRPNAAVTVVAAKQGGA